MTINTGDNLFLPSKWMVDPVAGSGTNTTIQAAINAASAGDTVFIRGGTYTEDLTLKAGVNITAFRASSLSGAVTIIGNATYTGTGTASICSVKLQTNANFLVTVSGSNASVLNLINVTLNCTNNSGISFTNSNAASAINHYFSDGDLGTTGISLHSMTSPGTLTYRGCQFTNTGATTTASNNSAGLVNLPSNGPACTLVA